LNEKEKNNAINQPDETFQDTIVLMDCNKSKFDISIK
jgi:hypothetical protein